MILLDTHAWVWWAADRAKLSAAARAAIAAEDERGISGISLWEVATLAANGKLILDRDLKDWIEGALASAQVRVVPIRADIAVRSTRLGHAFHGDPADRLIVATAISEAARLVTKDAKIRSYAGVESVW